VEERPASRPVRIELTEEQKKRLLEQTGEAIESVEFILEQLEPRIAPRQVGRFL
jgi:hypothetical protein